jgi:hypothetical protein
MPFVQRRNDQITGLFENQQPGMAEEWLDGTHPDVIAFISRTNRKADWDGFFAAKMSLLIPILVAAEATSPIAKQYVDFLKIEFSKRPEIDLPRMSSYWNAAISPVLTLDQIEELNLAAEDYYLPFHVNSQGVIF